MLIVPTDQIQSIFDAQPLRQVSEELCCGAGLSELSPQRQPAERDASAAEGGGECGCE